MHKDRKIIAICIISMAYALLGLYPYSLPSSPFSQIDQIVSKQSSQTMFSSIIQILYSHNLIGQWDYQNTNITESREGKIKKSKIIIHKILRNQTLFYELELQLYNGIYIDEGQKRMKADLHPQQWKISIGDHFFELSSHEQFIYEQRWIMKFVKSERIENQIIFHFQRQSSNFKLTILCYSETGQKIEINLGQQNFVDKIPEIIFGLFIFIMGLLSLFGTILNLQEIFNDQKLAKNYSFTLLTVLIIWDSLFCVLSFQFCIKPSGSFILFIVPSIIFTMLSGILDLLFMKIVWQEKCKIQNYWIKNFGFYGIMFIVYSFSYPILSFINFNSLFLFSLPFFIIFQLYNNACSGKKPSIFHPFYCYVFPRYLFLIYIKCFPWNVFNFRPDYLFGTACTFVIFLSIFLIVKQQELGPRIIFPRFILPISFEYVDGQNSRIQDNDECAICLNSFTKSKGDQIQKVIDLDGLKIIETPCQHYYHESCLKEWFKVKNNCPQCRQKLPALY